jgi:hypothetical protein
MANDSVIIEKHIKTYQLTTWVFNVNPGNQDNFTIFVFTVCDDLNLFDYV